MIALAMRVKRKTLTRRVTYLTPVRIGGLPMVKLLIMKMEPKVMKMTLI